MFVKKRKIAPLKIMCMGLSDPQWPKRIKRLCKEYNAEVVYWVSMKKRRNNVIELFPEAVYHNMGRAICGAPPREFFKKNPDFKILPLDSALLDAMMPYQLTAMKMMERLDADQRSFTFEERLRHYHRQVAYWYSVLSYLQPDLVFFPITPHANYDYITYGLCQHLGIETMMLDRTAIPSRVLIGRTIRDTSDKLAAHYRTLLAEYKDQPVELPPLLENYYNKMQGDYAQALPPNIIKKMQRMGVKSLNTGRDGFKKCLRYEISGLLNNLSKNSRKKFKGSVRKRLATLLSLSDTYLKERFKPPETSSYNVLDEMVARIKAKRIKNNLRRYYISHQQGPNLVVPYIYVALHYQPERNTVPIGEWFGDQLLMIELLSKSLPDGWKIYVKEHGQQWSYFSKGERGRHISLYKDVLRLGNTQLIPVDVPSFDLIDNARATATVAGSAGWESIIRGKPALVFGNAWYSGCEGAYRIRTREDCARAINDVKAGVTLSRNHTRLFLKALDENSVHTLIDTLREDAGDLNVADIMDNFIYGVGVHLANAFPDRVQHPQQAKRKPAIKSSRVMMLSETKTVLQEFVSLSEKFLDDGRLYPIIALNSKLRNGEEFKNATHEIETISLRRGGNAEWRKKTKRKRLTKPIHEYMDKLEKGFYKALVFLNRKLPAQVRDRALLAFNLGLLESKAMEIFETENIKALILPDDRVVGYNVAWLNAAKNLGIFTCVVPFSISHPEGGSFMRRDRFEHHLNKGWCKSRKKRFARKYPQHVYSSQYGDMLFYKPQVAKALEKQDMLPTIPWISGGGKSDKIFALSKEDHDLLLSLGVVDKEIEVVGQCALDYLWEAKNNKESLLKQMQEKYSLTADKPIIVFAIPHLAEHKICSWEVHEAKLRPILAMLAEQTEMTVLLSAHPRGKRSFYEDLGKEYALALIDEQLSKVLPVGTIFLATHSSTVRWAGLLGIPSIILDYDIGHTFLDNLKGNIVLNETHIDKIRETMLRLIQDAVFYERCRQQLVESMKDEQAYFDGKARERILEGVLEKIGDPNVIAVDFADGTHMPAKLSHV